MFKNYLLTAYRNLIRNRFFSLVNISGLAVGMAVCIMIAQYVVFENSFDRLNDNYENLYRIINVRHYPTHSDESAGSVVMLGPAMRETFPEVKEFTRCYKSDRVFLVNDNPVHFQNVFSVDSTFLKLFSFRITEGQSENLLSKPNTAVLTVSSAKALFGDEQAIGKTILQGMTEYQVEAIAADVPVNSHLKFDLLLSFVTDLKDPGYCITCNNRNTYVLLDPNADPAMLQAKMPGIVEKLHPNSDIKREYRLQPLSDIHLYSHLRMEHELNGNSKSVLALTVVAVLILVIAWLNYINLTTSMAIKRSAEVGIRKVNGSTRRNVMVQFLVESILVNFLALLLAIFIVQFSFPLFCKLVSIETTLTLFSNYLFWIILFGVLITGSVLYGFYPSFVVSSFKPIEALKGKTLLPGGVYAMRRTLVLLQFSFSIILIAGSLTVYKQILFMKNKDLGLQMDQTAVIPVPNDLRDSGDGLGNDLRQQPGIENLTYTSTLPGEENSGNVGGGFKIENASPENPQQVYFFFVDKNYFDFLSIDFITGSGFVSDQQQNDKNTEIVINDAARRSFGFATADEAIGKILLHDSDIIGRIKGVVRDHHTQSLDNPIMPAFFQYTKGKAYYLVKTNPVNLTENLTNIKHAFSKHYPNNPFEYFFLDDFFNKQYIAHIQFGQIFGFFTILAIFIACLGLCGLTLYVIRVRAKEIALRKVLGASVANLLVMLSTEYVKLTLASCVLATPVAYYLIEQWLSNFAYRIEMAWWMFVIPGISILLLALFTIAAQSIKTALSKPAESLRNE